MNKEVNFRQFITVTKDRCVFLTIHINATAKPSHTATLWPINTQPVYIPIAEAKNFLNIYLPPVTRAKKLGAYPSNKRSG